MARGASGPGADFAARNALLSLKLLARNLRTLPGRKALVLFTGGLAINTDHMSELTAAVNACNMANVTVYTVDIHGIGKLAEASPARPAGVMAGLRQTLLGAWSFPGANSGGFVSSFAPQGRGGGGATGGGAPVGGGATGGGATRRRRCSRRRCHRRRCDRQGEERRARAASPAPRTHSPETTPARIPGEATPHGSLRARPESAFCAAAQSRGRPSVSERHGRTRNTKYQRPARGPGNNRQGAERVLSDRLYAAPLGRGELPQAACPGGSRRDQGTGASGLLQRQTARSSFRKTSRKDSGEPRGRPAGRQYRRLHADPLLLYFSEHGARQCGHGNSVRLAEVPEAEGQASRGDRRFGHRNHGRRHGRRAFQRHPEAGFR